MSTDEIMELRERIIELRKQIDRQGEVIARLHNDLILCEAARQKHDRKSMPYKILEACRSMWGK